MKTSLETVVKMSLFSLLAKRSLLGYRGIFDNRKCSKVVHSSMKIPTTIPIKITTNPSRNHSHNSIPRYSKHSKQSNRPTKKKAFTIISIFLLSTLKHRQKLWPGIIYIWGTFPFFPSIFLRFTCFMIDNGFVAKRTLMLESQWNGVCRGGRSKELLHQTKSLSIRAFRGRNSIALHLCHSSAWTFGKKLFCVIRAAGDARNVEWRIIFFSGP